MSQAYKLFKQEKKKKKDLRGPGKELDNQENRPSPSRWIFPTSLTISRNAAVTAGILYESPETTSSPRGSLQMAARANMPQSHTMDPTEL